MSVSLFDFPLTPGAQRDLAAHAGCFPYESNDPFAPLSLGTDTLATSNSFGLATASLLASPRRTQSHPTVMDRLLGERSEGSAPTVVSAASQHQTPPDRALSSSNNGSSNPFANNSQLLYSAISQQPIAPASLNPMDQLHLRRHNTPITPSSTSDNSSSMNSSNNNSDMYAKQKMGSISNDINIATANFANHQSGAPITSLMIGAQQAFQFNKKNSPVNNSNGDVDDDDEDDEDMGNHRFKPFHEEKWSLRYKELLQFHKQHGHAAVPHTYPDNPQLARWVKRQRRQYKLRQDNRQSTMTAERLEMLNSVGFVWDSHDVNWREKLDSLMLFRQEYGNCNVPSNFRNKKLATWVKCQRRQYKLYWDGKPSAMSPERIMELEKVGFEWEIRATLPRKQQQVGGAALKPAPVKTAAVSSSSRSSRAPRPTDDVKSEPLEQQEEQEPPQDFHLLYQNLTDL